MVNTDPVWVNLRDFFRRFPESAAVLLVLVLLPILYGIIPEYDQFGPLIWTVMIIIGLPLVFMLLYRVFPFFIRNKAFRLVCTICLAALISTLTIIAILAAAHMLLPEERNGEGLLARANYLLFGNREETQPVESQEPLSEGTTTEPVLRVDVQAAIAGNSSAYNDCIQEKYAEGDRLGIVECVDIIEE